MGTPVTVSAKSDLEKIIKDLERIRDTAHDTESAIRNSGKETGDQLNKTTKKTEESVKSSSSAMRRMLDSLKSDFKSLIALNSLQSGLALSNQFRGTIKESITLSDTIRRLGATFGMASGDFTAFQSKMTRGLGDIGLSSEAAANALKGLAETPVRGQENLLEYSKTAGMLAGIGGEKGKEGDLAKGISGITQARGGNVNDIGQMKSVAEDVRRAMIATGKSGTDIISQMQQIFAKMPEDLQKKFSTRQLATLAAGATTAGPGATQFIQDFMSKSSMQRQFQSVTGQTKLFDEKGFNTEGIKSFYNEAKRLGSGDVRIGLKALGVESDEAADGFVRLKNNLDQVAAAQNRVATMTGDVTSSYRETMSAGDAFRASINRVKGFFSDIIAPITQHGTSFMEKASESNGGSMAMVAGGGIIAALLAGGGLRGIGGGLLGSVVKGKAAEAMTGKEVQPVYVTNAAEIGAGSAAGDAAKGLLGGNAGMFLKQAGMVAGAGAAGYAVGTGLDMLQQKYTQGTTSEGFEGSMMERFFFKMDQLMGGEASSNFNKNMKVQVELNDPRLKAAKQPGRGASN